MGDFSRFTFFDGSQKASLNIKVEIELEGLKTNENAR